MALSSRRQTANEDRNARDDPVNSKREFSAENHRGCKRVSRSPALESKEMEDRVGDERYTRGLDSREMPHGHPGTVHQRWIWISMRTPLPA